MKVEVNRLRLELLLSYPPPLLLPRRLPAQQPQQPYFVFRMTTGTDKMERGAQQTAVDGFSPADGTGSSKEGRAFSF